MVRETSTAKSDGRTAKFDVGGYWQERPFHIRRLGHIGLNCTQIEAALHFYKDLLGFRISDTIDFSKRVDDPSVLSGLGDPHGYFMRYGTDHHSFVLFNKRVRETVDRLRRFPPGVTVNQISWQVSTLAEVVAAEKWLRDADYEIQRAGRDMPGSNWHTYFYDPDGHTNELFYGMEQIGWSGLTKPELLYRYGARSAPLLPQISEREEILNAISEGMDLTPAFSKLPTSESQFEVGGVLISRPFKIVKIGPIRLFVTDLEKSAQFYEAVLGLKISHALSWNGYDFLLLRSNTEDHSVGLYPIELRSKLGLSEHSTTMSVGMQVGNYQQLRNARSFLLKNNVAEVKVPLELLGGVSWCTHFADPDGHLVELYDGMQQFPSRQVLKDSPERASDGEDWPETIEDNGTAFVGEPFFGPLE